MNKNAHPFKQLLVLFGSHVGMLILLLLIVFAIILAMVKNNSGDISSIMSTMDGNMGQLIFFDVAQSVLLFLVPVLIVANVFYRDSKREFYRFDLSSRKWLLALAGIATYALLMPLVDWLAVWNNHWNFGEMFSMMSEEYNQLIIGIVGKAAKAGFIGLLLMVLVLAVMPAIFEELFFRVGLQQLLGKWFRNDHIAIVVTALIFSFMHLEMNGFLVRFVLGLTLGYVFVYSRSLVPNVMLHFVNNTVVTVSSYVAFLNGTSLAEQEQPWMLHWLPTALCTIGALVLFWYCFVRKANAVQHQINSLDS